MGAFKPRIHLWTGIMICNSLKSWCKDEIIVENGKATNATDKRESATCEACIAEYDAAAAKVERGK